MIKEEKDNEKSKSNILIIVREERLNKIKDDIQQRRKRLANLKNSKSPEEKERFRNRSALNIKPLTEKNKTRKLLVINKLEGAIKNSTIHQSIKASEKIKDEKRKRELVSIYIKKMDKKSKLRDELLKKLHFEENERSVIEVVIYLNQESASRYGKRRKSN